MLAAALQVLPTFFSWVQADTSPHSVSVNAPHSHYRQFVCVPCHFQLLRVLFVLDYLLAYLLLLSMHRHCLLLLLFELIEPLLHIIQIMLLKLFTSRCLRHVHLLCLTDRLLNCSACFHSSLSSGAASFTCIGATSSSCHSSPTPYFQMLKPRNLRLELGDFITLCVGRPFPRPFRS